jgi:hypothetical protein
MMNKVRIVLITSGLIFVAITPCAQTGENTDVRSGIHHDEYDRLLEKYVNEQGLVNYAAWKQSEPDVSALDDYLKQFARTPDPPAQGNEKAAALVNAYNAFMLH